MIWIPALQKAALGSRLRAEGSLLAQAERYAEAQSGDDLKRNSRPHVFHLEVLHSLLLGTATSQSHYQNEHFLALDSSVCLKLPASGLGMSTWEAEDSSQTPGCQEQGVCFVSGSRTNHSARVNYLHTTECF